MKKVDPKVNKIVNFLCAKWCVGVGWCASRVKLLGNMTFNPISALTHATIAEVCEHDRALQLVHDIIHEAEAVAQRLGIPPLGSAERRIDGAYKRAGAHKTSMLQDVEGGRRLEVDAVLGSVLELARWVGVEMPRGSAVYTCASLLSNIIEKRKVRITETPLVLDSTV